MSEDVFEEIQRERDEASARKKEEIMRRALAETPPSPPVRHQAERTAGYRCTGCGHNTRRWYVPGLQRKCTCGAAMELVS